MEHRAEDRRSSRGDRRGRRSRVHVDAQIFGQAVRSDATRSGSLVFSIGHATAGTGDRAMSDRRVLQLETGPLYPGRGYPSRPGEDRPGLSPFGRLAMGQTIGKSSILVYASDQRCIQQAPVDMLTIEGDDVDACQLVLTRA